MGHESYMGLNTELGKGSNEDELMNNTLRPNVKVDLKNVKKASSSGARLPL